MCRRHTIFAGGIMLKAATLCHKNDHNSLNFGPIFEIKSVLETREQALNGHLGFYYFHNR